MRSLFLSSLLALVAAGFLVTADARACDCECDEDSDCHGLELCNLATNKCERPTDECINDDDCNDGIFCNGRESCDLFAGCVAGDEVDCSEGNSECSCGVCDEEIQGCSILPSNEGETCGDFEADTCVISAVCTDGACLVTPLCNETCERCDPAGCAVLCGNPFGNATDAINTTDALFALRAAVELEECALCVCDVNGDGTVTATDVLLMLRHIVGLGDLLVCPQGDGAEQANTTLPVP